MSISSNSAETSAIQILYGRIRWQMQIVDMTCRCVRLPHVGWLLVSQAAHLQ